jgi:hypothetical protein
MKKTILLLALIASINSYAQRVLTTPAPGGNKKTSVTERIGITDVTIHYNRPGVKGREGKIWGQLVHNGFIDQQFGPSKSAPWRAGANENTTIQFSTDVKVNGMDLPKGKYGFFIAYGAEESTLIFSKYAGSWGSYYYNEKEDALRLKIKPVALDKSVEWLKYEFSDETENSSTVSLMWEKLSFPFKVEVDLNKTQVESFRNELRTEIGFDWLPWQQAAQWCADHNTNLEEALLWCDTATNPNVLGNVNFRSLSTKAQIQNKLGKNKEAMETMKQAMPLANMNQIHGYGRQLLQQKAFKEALEIFKFNYEKYPNTYTTNMGMARGYSGVGDYKKALEYAEKAFPQAPDNTNKQSVEKIIGLLKEGKNINQ